MAGVGAAKAQGHECVAPRFAVVCDSSCDLDPALCQRLGVTLVSHRITLAADEYLDRNMNDEETSHVLSSRVRARVTAPGRDSFLAAYEELVFQGYHDIVVALPSSRLVESSASARRAAAMMDGVRVEVLDTGCVSVQLALVVARLVLDRDAGMGLEEAVDRAQNLARTARLWCLLPPTVDLERAHVLGERRGLRRSLLSLSMRVAGEWLMTTVVAEEGRVTVERRSENLSWLAGVLARTVSLYSQKEGPITMVELVAGSEKALAEMRKPLDTNEFESRLAATLSLRPASMLQMGVSAVGVAVAPQSLLDPEELARLFA